MKRTVQMARNGTRIKPASKKPRAKFVERITGKHLFPWTPGPLIVMKPAWFDKTLAPRIRRTAPMPFIKTIDGRWNRDRSKYMPHDGGGKRHA